MWSVKTLLRLSLKKKAASRGKDTVGTGWRRTIGHLCLGNFRRRLARVYVILKISTVYIYIIEKHGICVSIYIYMYSICTLYTYIYICIDYIYTLYVCRDVHNVYIYIIIYIIQIHVYVCIYHRYTCVMCMYVIYIYRIHCINIYTVCFTPTSLTSKLYDTPDF